MSKLRAKLESLYGLAKLSPDELKAYEEGTLDSGRLNEARTASFLLLHTARTKGVRLKFILNSDGAAEFESPPAPPPEPPKPPPRPEPQRPEPPPRRPDPTGGGFWGNWQGDMFDEMFREASRQRTAKAEEERRAQERAARGPHRKHEGGEPPPRVAAAIPGVCVACGNLYGAGERVWWVRSVGATHEACGYEPLRRKASGA